MSKSKISHSGLGTSLGLYGISAWLEIVSQIRLKIFFFYLLGASNYFNGIFCSYCFLLLWSDGSELFSIKKILKVEGLKLQAAILKYMWRYLCL